MSLIKLFCFLKYNFVGKLLGPKGNSLKWLQEQTQTKMAILGRGSMRNKEKVWVPATLDISLFQLVQSNCCTSWPNESIFRLHKSVDGNLAYVCPHGALSHWRLLLPNNASLYLYATVRDKSTIACARLSQFSILIVSIPFFYLSNHRRMNYVKSVTPGLLIFMMICTWRLQPLHQHRKHIWE